MDEIGFCPECKVPETITRDYRWLNSGVMVQTNNMARRVGFIESENLDPLYKGIGAIVGKPIDHLVIDLMRRGTADYFESLIPPEARGLIRDKVMGVDAIADFMMTMGQLNGFGKYELLDFHYEGGGDDFTLLRVTEPFSVLLCAGANAGASEATSGNPHTVSYRQVSPDIIEIKASVTQRDEPLEVKMPVAEYRYREGDIELEKCASCGGPKALSGFKWLLNRGIIVNTWTNRRMAMEGPEAQDPLFKGLEKKLGKAIPAAVVEAQRLFVKTGFYSIEDVSDEGDLRTQLALRGMGNLREVRMTQQGLRMRVDDPAAHLMIVGFAQGLFEMAFDVESRVDWELSAEGDLQVEVNPGAVMVNV